LDHLLLSSHCSDSDGECQGRGDVYGLFQCVYACGSEHHFGGRGDLLVSVYGYGEDHYGGVDDYEFQADGGAGEHASQ